MIKSSICAGHSVVVVVLLAVSIFVGTESRAAENLTITITDNYKFIGQEAMSLSVEILDEALNTIDEIDAKDEGPGIVYLPLSEKQTNLLPSVILCFRIDNVVGYDDLLILRDPCHPSRGRTEFSLSVKTPTDYGVKFRETANQLISNSRGGIQDFQTLHEGLVMFHRTQSIDRLTIEDVRLFARFVKYVDIKASYAEDGRFFSLNVFDNPLSEISRTGYISDNIFSFLEAKVAEADEIESKLEIAISELFMSYQRIRPDRFVDPGQLQDEKSYFEELFGLVLALNKLKPGGFEVSRIPPLQRYAEKCNGYGSANAAQRDFCLAPLLNNIGDIKISSYRQGTRKTTATKVAQSIDCASVVDFDARSTLSNFFSSVLRDDLCGENNIKCSQSVRQCLTDLG